MALQVTPAFVDSRIQAVLGAQGFVTQEQIASSQTLGFKGWADLSTTPDTGAGPQFWRPTIEAISYPNFGGLSFDPEEGVVDFVYDGTSWAKSVTVIDLANYASTDSVGLVRSSLDKAMLIEDFSDKVVSGYVFEEVVPTTAITVSKEGLGMGLNVDADRDDYSGILNISDVDIPNNKTVAISFKIVTLEENPAIGVGWGSSPSVNSLFGYRKNGSIISWQSGAIGTPSPVSASRVFVAGDTITLYIKKSESEGLVHLSTALNGVLDSTQLTLPVVNFDNFYYYFRGTSNSISSFVYEKSFDPFSEESISPLTSIFVSKSGNDSNTGSSGSPVLTINKALTLVNRPSTIIVGEGDYRETLDFSSFSEGDINIIFEKNKRTRIMGSNKLSTFTKTAGRTNVYQAVYSLSIPSRKVIYEDGRNSKPIELSQRHGLQKGVTHRLPFTVMESVESITDCDSTPGTYFYDEVLDMIYIHPSDSDNPLTNGYSYEVPSRASTVNTPNQSTLKIELNNVSSYFSSSFGFNVGKCGVLVRRNCKSMGSDNDGFKDSANLVVAWNDEIADCRDGCNGHFDELPSWNGISARFGRPMAYYYGQWSHDNTDDGISHHEKGEVHTFGCLYEYNGKSGMAPASGCQMTDHHSICRNNNQNPEFSFAHEGVTMVNALLAGDDSFGTCFTGFGTVCEGNRVGFNARSDSNSRMILHECVSRNNEVAEYRASLSTLISNNCKATNSDPLKIQVVELGGIIIVNNDTDLV